MGCLKDSHFWIHMSTLPSPTIFTQDLMLLGCLYLFYYCHYYFSLFFYLVLFFVKWLYNRLLNFSFCKYILSHSISICSKMVLLPGAFLFTLSVSLRKFLMGEIPGTSHLPYLVILNYTIKIHRHTHIYILI